MKKFLRKNKKYIGLILIAAIVFNFLFLPLTALAQGNTNNTNTTTTNTKNTTAADTDPTAAAGGGGLLSWISSKILLFISSFISMILGSIFGVVLWLEAQVIDYIISPANFSFTNTPIVTLGWGITRDLANMFFILILLIIAFATVLKIQSYAINQLWWKVLVAALLINFSLVIAGFVIDFTQVLTSFFLHQITGGAAVTITTRLASSMQILNFYNPAPPTSVGQGIAQLGGSSIAAVVGIVLTLAGLVITVFVFGAAAVFLIVRILYIWFLLIIAPIVWMLWILPATSRYFSQWWDKFIQWAFFAPIYVFMIYLSLSIFDANGDLHTGVLPQGNATWGKATPGLTTVGMPSAIFQWILVIAMMFGSLIVAQKFGVEGAAGARKILTGWGTGAKNWAGRQLRRQGVQWTQPLPEGAPKPTGFRGFIRRTGALLGGVATAVPGVRGAYLKQVEEERKAYAATYNKYKDSDPAILSRIRETAIDPRDRTAVEQAMIERDLLKPKAEEMQGILNRASKYGQEEKLLDIISGKDFFSPDYGYNLPELNNILDRSKRYGKEEKIMGIISDKLIGRNKGQILPKANELEGLLGRTKDNPNLTRKMIGAVAEKLGEKGLKAENGYDDKNLIKLIQEAEKVGKGDDLLKIFPQFTSKIEGKDIATIIGKIKGADAPKMSVTALDNSDVVNEITKQFISEHIMNLAKEGRSDVIDKIEGQIRKLPGITNKEKIENLEKLNPRLGKWMKSSPGNTFFKITPEKEEPRIITQVGRFAKVPPPEERKG